MKAMFQSTPVITDGRRMGGALPEQRKAGFNPRPSSLTGDASKLRSIRFAKTVSIHARHH